MSTAAQLKGDSLRRQLDLSETYAAEHDLDLQRDALFSDIGVSAFRGANLSASLGAFLAAVRDGTVERGSYLLVESFDRLSRDKIDHALTLFLQITGAGINIVTLADRQVFEAGKTNLQQLIVSLVSMSRANEESEIKSQRLRAVWENKRAKAGAATEPLTGKCPAWVELHGNGFRVIPGRGEIVQRIFEMASLGMGSDSIARELNRQGIKPLGRSNGWGPSYVTKILKNPAVLGKLQPHRLVDGRRMPAGPPITDYFPVLIDEQLFLRVQAGRRSRGRTSGGRRGLGMANLFTHVAKCEYCGAPMHFVNKGRGPRGGTYLKCSTAIRGMGCIATGWRYKDFESSFLFFAKELDLGAVMNSESAASEKRSISTGLAANSERIARLEEHREGVFSLLRTAGTDFVRTKLAEAEQQLLDAHEERLSLETALAEAFARDQISAEDLRGMIDKLQSDSPDMVRRRLQVAGKLRELVSSLNVAVEGRAPGRVLRPAYSRRDSILATVDAFSVDDETYRQPTFTVVFADGVSRRVAVNREEPLDYIIEEYSSPNGDDSYAKIHSDEHQPLYIFQATE